MISTGVPTVDAILRGGLHSGVVDTYGVPGTGRTAFGASLLKQASLEGRPVVLVAPGQLDKEWYGKAGVPGSLTVLCVSSWQDLGRVLPEILVRIGKVVVVVDPVCALDYGREDSLTVANREEENREAANARADALQVISRAALASDSLVLLVSEARADLTSRWRVRSSLGSYCDRYLSAVLLFDLEETKNKYGRLAYKTVFVHVVRSKHSAPGGKALVHVFPDGIHKYTEKLKLLIATKKLEPRGGYWVMPSNSLMLGPGYTKAAEQLEEYETSGGVDR